MPKTIVYINGQRVDYRKASISVFDYTLHCAIGLFESVLAVDDRLILLDEHLRRMETGCQRLGIKFNYNRNRIATILKKAVSEHPARVKKTKTILTYGYSPLWPGNRPSPKTIIIVTDHRLEFKKQKLMVSPMIISSANPMRGVKTVNFMTEWMSQKRAHEAGYHQGIVVNQRGQIAETGSANLFMVRGGQLFTPALDIGGLPGTIRYQILKLAKANNIPCHEIKLTPQDLIDAEELFTTSSFKLVWPVVELKTDRIHRFLPGRLSRALFNRLKTNFLNGTDEVIL